jgi:hypothetical protein
MWMPCLVRSGGDGERPVVRLGHELVDDYLEFPPLAGHVEYAAMVLVV